MAEVSLGAGVSPPAAPVLRTGDEILTAFAGPGRQRRVTVLFRPLLVIPHYIVLYALGIAVEIVAVICWFAALFTGRLPDGLADFLVGWLRWSTRVFAYVGLLTDQYPPFTLTDADYPVRVSAAPGRLNRLAVLFRIILALPVAILVGILWSGVLLAGLVIWLIVLITGTMPGPAYQAVAAVVRFGARFYGYFYLMSGTYPGGLFGDPADADAAAVAAGPVDAGPVAPSPGAEPAQPDAVRPAAPPLDAAQPPAAQPGEAVQPRYGQTGYGQPGYAAPDAAHRGATASWPADPRAWRLVLSSGAKQLVSLFIVLGSIVLVGYISVGVVAASHAATGATRVNAINSVSAAHAKLSRQLSGLSQQITACQSQSAVLSCVTKLDEQAAQDFGAFASAVRSTPVPPSAAAAAGRLAAVTGQVQSAFQQLGTATSVAEYRKIDSNTVVPTVDQFNSAYQNLGAALGAT